LGDFRIEQRTLLLSICGVLVAAVGRIAYGRYLESDVVILNVVFPLFSLIGASSTCRSTKPGCPSA
jgi:hypothetical protein